MTLDTEEQEQVEYVKKWIAEYGFIFVSAILISVLAFFGWQRWSTMHERAMEHASLRYEQLLDALEAHKTVEANRAAHYLIQRYPHSTYAKLAELLLARRDVSEQKYEEAEKKCSEVINDAKIPAVKEIARLRLARLQIQLQQPEAALKTLEKIKVAEYLPTAAAIKGDASVVLHHVQEAAQFYEEALAGLPESAILHTLVLMKRNDLPV